MKKIFNILLLAVLMLTVTTTPAFAQDARQRTTQTIVQDALALMPLQNQTDFNREMEDIAKAAPKSIEVLVGMMQPTEKAKNSLMEYAINGVTNFASANAKYKKAVLDGLRAAAPKAPDQYVRQFIESQIRLLAGDEKPIEFVEHAGAAPYAQAYDNLKKLGANAGPAIIKALKSKDHALRMQALKFATANNLATDELAKQVVGKFKKQTEEGKADIINWLGDNKIASQKPFLTKVLTQGGKPAVAAIEALGKIGGDDAATALIAQLGGDNFEEATKALLSFKGDISGKVTEALKVTTGQQQNRLLSLASFRRITSAAPVVFDLAKSNSAARKALAGVVGKNDISKVAQLLDTASDSEMGDYQKALSASIKSTAAGNEIVSITAKPNESFKRTAVITLRAGNADKLTKDNSEAVEITIEQAGKPVGKMELESSYVEFEDYKAGRQTIGVINADEVSIKSSVPDWLTVSATKTAIDIKVKENTTPQERVTEIAIIYKRTVQTSATSSYTQEVEETIMVVQPGNNDYPINGTWEYRQLVAGQTTIYRIEFSKNKYEYSVIEGKTVTDEDSGTFTITDYSERKNTTFNYTEIHGKITLGSGKAQTFYTAKFEKNGPLYLIIGSTRYEKK